MRRFFILLVTVIALTPFVYARDVDGDICARPTVDYKPLGICKTTASIDPSSEEKCSGFSTCREVCQNSYDGDESGDCWNSIKDKLQGWSTYEITETRTPYTQGGLRRCDITFSSSFSGVRTCSTGDKMCSAATSCSPSPYLWSGTCTCDIGNKYKVCCLTENGGKRQLIHAELSGSDNDNILPEEGDCPMYMGNVETITDNPSAPLTCPQPPEINITVNGTSGTEFNIKNGDEVTVAWRVTGYDRVTDTNITGVTGSPSSGSYSFIAFKPGAAKGEKLPLWITASDDYTGYTQYNADDNIARVILNTKTITLISNGDGLPSCPLILDKPCELNNYQPQLPAGEKAPDGTTNDYSKDAKKYITLDKTKYMPVPDGKSCCSVPACSRCSTSNLGKFSNWTGMLDNTCNGDWSTVKYEPPGAENDKRCEIKNGCAIKDWRIDPTTVTKGGKTKISWIPEAVNQAGDPLDKCSMASKTATKENPLTPVTDKKELEAGPLNENTVFTLSCSTKSGRTCEAGGGDFTSGAGLVKIGCQIDRFISDGTKISDDRYRTASSSTNLSWTVQNAESCDINGTAAAASPISKNLQSGNNSFLLSCKTKSAPTVKCEKTIVVERSNDLPPGQCSVTFTANPSSIKSGGGSTLSWTTRQVSNCALLGKSFGSSGSYPVSPSSLPASYTITCTAQGSSNTCSKTVTISENTEPSNCVGSFRDASVSMSATPICLPSQPGGGTSTTVKYNASAGSSCSTAIGGGSPSNSNINCSATGWSPSGTSQTLSPGQTTTYSTACQRDNYTCSRSDTYEESDQCTAAKDAINNDYVSSSSCTAVCGGGTYRAVSDRSECGSGCSYDCTEGYWTDKTCYKTCYEQCPVFDKNGREIGTKDCNPYDCDPYDCDYYTCTERSCYADTDYRLSAASKTICGSSDSDSLQVRVIQKPNAPTISAYQGSKAVYQILLNQFFNLSWSVSAPSSLVPTILRCTATGSGDPEHWDDNGLNGLGRIGNVYDTKYGEIFHKYLFPDRDTTYRLWCRNQDRDLPNSCYNDGPEEEEIIKVYTPDLKEKGPTSFNLIKKFTGMIGGGW